MLNTLSLPKLNQPGSDPEGSPGPKGVSQGHIVPKNKNNSSPSRPSGS